MSEKKFVTGLFVNPPRAKAPDFVKGGLGIKVTDFIEWLRQQETNNGFVNIDLKESKTGQWYAELNDWKPGNQPQAASAANEFDDKIPF